MLESWDLLSAQLPDFAIKISVSLLCGLLLGMERERKDKPAGLRTIVLITLGSTLFMIVSELIPLIVEGPSSITQVDPSRIASGVVSGIGFLGAGTIIQARGAVHGLTTAAVIWVSSAIGMCCGVGYTLFAFLFTLLILTVLITLEPLRVWLSRFSEKRSLILIVPDDTLILRRIEYIMYSHDVDQNSITITPDSDTTLQVHVEHRMSGDSAARLLEALSKIEGVHGTPYASEPH